MKRVTGIGGIFFKANDPGKLHEWYEKHLGLKREPGNYTMLRWREADDPESPGRRSGRCSRRTAITSIPANPAS